MSERHELIGRALPALERAGRRGAIATVRALPGVRLTARETIFEIGDSPARAAADHKLVREYAEAHGWPLAQVLNDVTQQQLGGRARLGPPPAQE